MATTTARVCFLNPVFPLTTRTCSPRLFLNPSTPTGEIRFTATASEIHYDSLEREQDFIYLKLTVWYLFSAVWFPWLWRTAKQAAFLLVRSTALWKSTSLISRWGVYAKECRRIDGLSRHTMESNKCYLQYTVLSITALLRPHLMDGKILYATTCPWTSASRRWRTRWAVPPERAVFGHSILQRSIKWRKRCRNGNAKISQPSVAAWPIQVSNRWLLSVLEFHLWLTSLPWQPPITL